jgi:peptidylprolyl isomerase
MKKPLALAVALLFAASIAALADDSAPPVPAAPPVAPQVKAELVQKGEGRAVKKDDIVLAHIGLSLAEGGKVLVDTRKQGDPQALVVVPVTTPPIEKVLMDTLLTMKQGDRVKVDVPWQLGYGEQPLGPRGQPPVIPGKSDLKLDIEVTGFLEIQTEVLHKGSGPVAAKGDLVLVHYTGTFADGKVFDSSRERDAPLPITAGAGQVIAGWDITLLKMSVGDRLKVTIPWQLAYGANGKPPGIPPKADLTFDMERMPLPEIKHEVVTEGKGAALEQGQTVTVHYTGTLLDGTEFDSSRKPPGQPFKLLLGGHQVIPGWEMVLAKMKVGDRWKVTIPWIFAYGAQGQPPAIPAKADLVFDMEVLDAR